MVLSNKYCRNFQKDLYHWSSESVLQCAPTNNALSRKIVMQVCGVGGGGELGDWVEWDGGTGRKRL